MPSSWATICANVVSCPWPCDWQLTPSTALPVGWTRRSAPSAMPSPTMSMCLRGPAPTVSVKNEMPMPISSPRARFSCLLATQVVVARHLERLAHRALVLARVVGPARLVLVRELLRLDEVLQPDLRGVHVQLAREHVDHALDQVDRLGHPERARVRDAAGRLVGVDAVDLAVRGLQVVRAGEDVEEPGRELRRLRGRVERAVVGDHLHADALDLAVLRRGDLAVHDVVARERRRGQVLRPVLHPLDRLAGEDRADDRADVARVDPDLVAEAAADVRARSRGSCARAARRRARRACGGRAAPASSCTSSSWPDSGSMSASAPQVSIGAGCTRG